MKPLELQIYLGNEKQQHWLNTISELQYAEFLKEMDERGFTIMNKDYSY